MPPLFRMWAATVLTSSTLESRFFRICSSTPSSSSRYTSQTSAMLWSVRVVGPFDMGRIVGQETPLSQALVGGFVVQFAPPFS
ncbi:MAG: hypothetical protein LZF60_380228 [Nitrospira sp.]|nr:MAG: hypothetical protein LZF60_380228 [Nitrospira sp.]